MRSVPNLISLARLPLAAAFVLSLGRPAWALAVLALAVFTDMVDGWYARHFHATTALGAILDGVMDKVFAATVIVSMIVFGWLTIAEGLLLATREIGELLLLIRWIVVRRIRERRVTRSANRLGKLATSLQLVTVAALLLGAPHRAVWIAVTAVCGAGAAIAYGIREWRAGGSSPTTPFGSSAPLR
jgi:phosphatidylglycerophosphate synthase